MLWFGAVSNLIQCFPFLEVIIQQSKGLERSQISIDETQCSVEGRGGERKGETKVLPNAEDTVHIIPDGPPEHGCVHPTVHGYGVIRQVVDHLEFLIQQLPHIRI